MYNAYAGWQVQPSPVASLQCDRCGCGLMEERRFGRFSVHHPVVVGTPLPLVHQDSYLYFYFCARCGWPVEQPLQYLGVDSARLLHNEILNFLREEWHRRHASNTPTD